MSNRHQIDRAANKEARTSATNVDVIVVGAGFGGLYALFRMRAMGYSVAGFEAGSGVGGTWFWNRYPGARCDTESLDYSYSFSAELEQEWAWSERYATQPEILRYLEHVADRFDLRPLIHFNTRVTHAHFDEEGSCWTVSTNQGAELRARFVVFAAGVLSAIKNLDFPGLENFGGECLHTARWPREGVDLVGKRVAVIGTGSSGVQVIPVIARDVAHLYVFQRTANFSVPARNRPLADDELRREKATYADRRRRARSSRAGMIEPAPVGSALEHDPRTRELIYEERWQLGGGPPFLRAFNDLATNEEANATAADFVRSKIRQTVRDQQTAESLCPTGFPIGTKRICVDTGYFETYGRDNVTLIDLKKTPLVKFTERGTATTRAEIDLDVVIFATGFDAITGALTSIDIRGRNGETIAQHWADGPRTMLGVAVSGFPNLFTVTGPGSPSVLGNVVTSIEQHVDWIAECIGYADSMRAVTIEATEEGERWWSQQTNDAAAGTLLARAASWYTGANVPGKPRALLPYTGGVGRFREICADVAHRRYVGFQLGGPDVASPSPTTVQAGREKPGI